VKGGAISAYKLKPKSVKVVRLRKRRIGGVHDRYYGWVFILPYINTLKKRIVYCVDTERLVAGIFQFKFQYSKLKSLIPEGRSRYVLMVNNYTILTTGKYQSIRFELSHSRYKVRKLSARSFRNILSSLEYWEELNDRLIPQLVFNKVRRKDDFVRHYYVVSSNYIYPDPSDQNLFVRKFIIFPPLVIMLTG